MLDANNLGKEAVSADCDWSSCCDFSATTSASGTEGLQAQPEALGRGCSTRLAEVQRRSGVRDVVPSIKHVPRALWPQPDPWPERQRCKSILQELDRYEAQHVEFWEAMATVAEHELAEAQRQEEIDRARVRGEAPPPHLQRREAGWHASIDADVSSMLAGEHSCTLPSPVALAVGWRISALHWMEAVRLARCHEDESCKHRGCCVFAAAK